MTNVLNAEDVIMAKKLTLKQRKFTKEFIDAEGNATEAAFRTYNVKDRRIACLMGYRNLQKPFIKAEIERLLESSDITDDFLLQKLKEGLDANVVASYRGDANQTEVPDQNVRHKFFQDAAKMKNWITNDTEVKNLNIDLEVENLGKEDLTQLLTQLLKETKKDVKSLQSPNR